MVLLARFLVGHRCIICDEVTARKIDLCDSCEAELPFLSNCCKRCATPLVDDHSECGQCLQKDLPAINTTAIFHYQSPIDQLIMQLKFGNNLTSAKILGELMATNLVAKYRDVVKPQLIIPVPLSQKRLKERGYNQALELAYPIAKKLAIPIEKYRVVRIKHTEAQAKLIAKRRIGNLKGAFKVIGALPAIHVAIVDDVITTGSTAFELARTLQRSGVSKVDIWCCAKA